MNAVVNGWTIVTQTRQETAFDHMQGVFLATCGDRWVAGRQYDGKEGSTGFTEDGEWWYGSHFSAKSATENMLGALDRYSELAMKADVWTRMFTQDATQSLCRLLAGPERPDLPKLSAGWRESDPGHRNPGGGVTEPLPFHEAKYHLLWFLIWSTRLNAMDHLTEGVTIDRHQAHTLVREATGPVRFELGYNTYWLATTDEVTR
ncbi:hypothetical protein [Streptomyces anulatus]|uniref:hypothetical protein n=1 Tax=Streptomyces anulatus TaxID=1892 RepID=UPI00343E085A